MNTNIINDIFRTTNFIPSPEMTDMERLTALFSLVIFISFILYIFVPQKQYWLYFLGCSATTIVIIRLIYPYTEFKGWGPYTDKNKKRNEEFNVPIYEDVPIGQCEDPVGGCEPACAATPVETCEPPSCSV